MRLRSLCVASLLVSIGAFAWCAVADEGGLPKTATPRLAIVERVSNTTGTILCSWLVSKPVWETRSREVNGLLVPYRVVHFVSESRRGEFSQQSATSYDSQGNELPWESSLSRLHRGDVIVVSEDGKPVDKAYLRVFKSDVLVIVPAQGEIAKKFTTPPPAPPTPPGMTPPPAPPAPPPAPLTPPPARPVF
jgi:hypothetical protein